VTLVWLDPEVPKVAGLKPHVQRSACLRYVLHLSWYLGRKRYIAWHTSFGLEHERVGEFRRSDDARTACEAHVANLEHQAQLRRGFNAAA
jgi:hypothetical protein